VPEPLAFMLLATSSMAGNNHSDALYCTATCPLADTLVPVVVPAASNWVCHGLMIRRLSDARTNTRSGALIGATSVFQFAVCRFTRRCAEPCPLTLQVAGITPCAVGAPPATVHVCVS
jgi:hypothetical protein